MIKYLLIITLTYSNLLFASFSPSVDHCSRQRLIKEDNIVNAIDCANAKFIEAMGVRGFFYLTKFDTPQTLEEAYNWSKKAADKGDRLGVATLASLYFFNLRVKENEEDYLFYSNKINRIIKNYDEYRLALKEFNYNLPLILEKTYNHLESIITVDKKLKYWEFLNKEADKQDLAAILIMANAFKEGNSYISQDYIKTTEYFLKASDLGDPCAYMQIGLLYEDGKGYNKDVIEAKKYYQMSADKNCISSKVLILSTPTPFNIEINKTKIEDLKKNPEFETVIFTDEKIYSPVTILDTFFKTKSNFLDLDDLKIPILWNIIRFDEDGTLAEVKIELPNDKFNDVLTFCTKNYILKEEYSTNSTIKYFQAGRANIILSNWDNINYISLVYSKANF